MSHGEKFTIEHPMPTREQRIAEIDRKIAAGEPLGASHVPEIVPGVMANGSLNGAVVYTGKPCTIEEENRLRTGNPNWTKLAPSDKPRWPCRGIPRKSHNRNGSACHGKDVPCMPGLKGKCVACFDDD